MKLHLPHKFQAALIAALASVSFTTLSTGTIAVATGAALLAGQQAQAADEELTSFTTTNYNAGTANNFNAKGFIITLNGPRLTTSPTNTYDLVYLDSITLASLRAVPGGSSVTLALADANGKVLSLSDNAVSSTGQAKWDFSNTTVATDSPLYFYWLDTAKGIAKGDILTSDDMASWDNAGCGSSGVSNYNNTQNLTSCGFLEALSVVQNTQYAPKLTIVTSGPVPQAEYTWNATSTPAYWDEQTTNWTLRDVESKYTSSVATIVNFNDGAFAKEVTVVGAIEAGTVNVGANYKFTVGSGASLSISKLSVASGAKVTVENAGELSLAKITGAGALEVGAGTVNLSGGNDFSGGLTVSGGVVHATQVSALGTGTLTATGTGVIEIENTAPGDLTVAGDGTLRLITTYAATSQQSNVELGDIHAANLSLAADEHHSSRFRNQNNPDLSGVGHLYFDGGQLWVSNAFTYGGDVTFNETVYKEVRTQSDNKLNDAALRVNANVTLTGKVDVAHDTRFTWQASNLAVEFGGEVVGSGNLELAIYSGSNNTFRISGDASAYAGSITSASGVALDITNTGKLSIGSSSNLAGTVSLAGQLNVNGGATISGALSGAGTLAKVGTGTFTLSNNYTGFTGNVRVQGGTLALGSTGEHTLNQMTLAGGELSIGSGLIVTPTAGVSVTGDSTLTVDGTLKLSSTSPLQVNNAALTLAGSGTIDLGDMELKDGESYKIKGDPTVKDPNNGFTVTSGYVEFATLTGTASITGGTQLKFTRDGGEGAIDPGNTTHAKFAGNANYGTFSITLGTETLSEIREWSKAGGETPQVQNIELSGGAQLNVDETMAAGMLAPVSGATKGTVNITSTGTFTSDGDARNITITGAGTYALTKTTASGNWNNAPMIDALAPEWTGTVKLANMTKLGNLNLNNYGNEHSTVMLDNVTAYLNATTFNTKLLLGSGGFTVVDGGSGSTYTFAGGVGGEGNFNINYTSNPGDMSFVFSGDVKDWTGSLDHNRAGKANKVVFKGGATVVNATITCTNGTLNMEVGDGTAFTTTFNETVGASSLTVKAQTTATFMETVTMGGDINLNGNSTATFEKAVSAANLRLGDNGTQSYTGATATFNGLLTLTGDLTVNGTTAVPSSARLNAGGSVSVIDLSHGGNAHGTVTVAAGKTLTYGSSFWGANNNKLILEEGATVKKATDAPIEIVGLEGGGYVSSSANEQFGLDKSAYTLHNVVATVNTDSADVQLHFDNSKFATSHTVTLKNTESVFSGMEISGGTTTVGATGLTADTTVNLGAVTLSGGSLTLADHVIGAVDSIAVAEGTSNTISGYKLDMGTAGAVALGGGSSLTLDGVTVDLTHMSSEGEDVQTLVGGSDGAGKNGFVNLESKVRLFSYGADASVALANNPTFLRGVNTGTLTTEGENKGLVTFNGTAYSVFYVNAPEITEHLASIVEAASTHGGLQAVYLNGGTLNADMDEKIAELHLMEGDGAQGSVALTGPTANFGTVSGKGTLNVAAATTLTADTLSIAAGATLTLTGSENISFGTIANRGTLGIGTGTKVATTGDITVSAGDTFTTTGEGTLASTAELKVLGGTATLGSESEWSAIRMGNGSLNINADTTVSGMVELGPENGQMNGNLTVNNGATLTASQVKASWGYSTMAINGIVNATEKFSIATGSSNEVTGTGTINTANLDVSNVTVKATFKGGLTINVGDGGITGGQPLELQDVTIGVLEGSNGWSASRAIILGSADTGTTFNIGNGKEVTLSGAISGSGKLVKDGDGTLNLNGGNSFSGSVLVDGGTVKLGNGNALGAENNTVTIEKGATVDVNGKDNRMYSYTLHGGSLVNNGADTLFSHTQNNRITLTDDSTVGGSGKMWMIAGSWGDTTANLNNHTLTKEGTGTFSFVNTDISAGTIMVNQGTVEFYNRGGNNNSNVQANIVLNGGTISGAYNYTASDSAVTRNLTVNQSAVTSAAITIGNNVTLAANVAANQVLTLGGAITGTGNFSLSGAGTLKLAGSDMISANTLTFASGSTLDISNIAQMAGITVNLASYTDSASYSDLNITGLNSGLTYKLTDDGSHVAITFAGTPSPTPFKPVVDLGNVMYVGDSITDGVTSGSDHAKSWRYSFFQVLADGGIDQTEQGYYQHHQSSGAIPEGTIATYGGRDFQNIHSAQASARSAETAGDTTLASKYNRYGYSSIQNWLGQRDTMRNGADYPEGKPVYKDETAPETYFMLLGTNDLLSEGGDHVSDAHFSNVLDNMFGYNGSTFDGETGTFDIIWKSMTTARKDSQLIVLEMPTWSPDHTNHQYAADFAYMTKFNQKLHEWAASKESSNITIVNPNLGIVDVANTTKPGAGVASMFLSDHLHPSAQGELLIAGNVARQLGYAGRTVGLDRASHTNPGSTAWNAAGETTITVTDGAEAQTFAENAFNTTNGYTIDFGALYGDGFSGGWSDKAKALTVQVGDGYNIGTLTFSEAYVMWGNTVLYSRDNSQEGDNFRIAYVNQSVNEEDHVSTGYYVWMGDQLIGEALSGVSGSFNGISLTSTGANGTVKNLTWSDTAYAPTTTLYENPDTTKLFHLEQANTLPTHTDTPQGIKDDIEWQTTTDKFALPSGQSSTAKTIYKEFSSNIGANYTGAANANYEGDIGMHYTGTADMDARQSVLSVYNATVTGNVYVQFDNPNTVYNSFTNTNRLSVTAGYNGNITGSYTAVYNAGIFNYDVRGGEHTNANATIGGGSNSYVNGGTFKANVMGGGVTGTINGGTHVTVSGGEIAGSVYGGGIGGTINDGTYVTITGGVIAGNVIGGGTGGTINGGTHVTVEGILPSIKGNISADNVTLKDVVNPQEYVDGFDSYAGTITATTLTLDNYKAGEMLATVTAANLALTNGTATTINNLTTAAGTAISVDATSSLTLGQANLSAAIANAGTLVLTQNITASGLEKAGEDVSYRVGADDAKSTNDNYFYQGERTESTLRVVSGEGNLQVADGLTVTQGGHAYTLASDGTATGVSADGVDYSTFYQGQAGTTVSVSEIAATAAKHNAELVGVYSLGAYENPTVLNVDQNLANAVVAFSTVNIASGVEYTGNLLVFGGMNTVSGQIETARLGFCGGNASVTTFTEAPVVDAGVRFSSDAGAGGVQVHANQRSAGDGNYYEYSIEDSNYAVVASELSKEGEGDANVANSLMVQRVHNSEASSTGKLTLSAGAVNMSLQEVVATSGDIEFLNMAAASATQEGKQTSVSLNKLEIGAGKTVSFYEAAAPATPEELAKEAVVTVKNTLTAGTGATLNSDLVMESGSVLNVSEAQESYGLTMGSSVFLKNGNLLGENDLTLLGGLGYGEYYYLFNDVEDLYINGEHVDELDFQDWQHFDLDASQVYANLDPQTYALVYNWTPVNGSNVGTIAITIIPEPTTGTLSLLALAALAARRRRK